MRYLMLIYAERQPDTSKRNFQPHRALIEEATREGVFVAAEPLSPPSCSTTLRVENGKTLISDGPFIESKEQLAGYYIFDCKNLDDALDWAARIPQACSNPVTVEIRPMPGIPAPSAES
ncbi:MAG TPA: YciI family protein [Terriglobales bacterium]|nr:YciI family protein [Terriglobales bacterium]